jgi:hypothetical protein
MKTLLMALSLLVSISAYSQNTSVQLHDLYEPEPVQFQFETPGWYILAGLIFIAVILIIIQQTRKYIKNRYRREAINKLGNLSHDTNVFPQLFEVLKKTAMHAFGREHVGHLYGKEWLAFLEKTGKGVKLIDYQEQIYFAIYGGKKIESETQKMILSNALKWVKSHASKL